MRFRVQNIKPGYCEIWANEYPGQRYLRLALVMYDDEAKTWHWSAKSKPPLFMPHYSYEFRTRREAIVNCKRTALKMLVECAIAQQTEESPHWHSPRRDAWCDVMESNLFTWEEEDEIKKRLMTF